MAKTRFRGLFAKETELPGVKLEETKD